MKKLISILALVAALGCSKTGSQSGTGSIDLTVSPDGGILELTKGDVSDYATVPAAGDFNLVIKNYASEVAWEGKFKDWDPQLGLTVGEYTATASYGNVEDEGKNKPCFLASESFTVEELSTVPVTLRPSLANCIVKLSLGSYLKSYYPTRSFSVETALATKMTMEEGDAVFMDAYKFTLSGSLETSDGRKAEFSKTFESLAAATCYDVKVELTNVAGLSFTVTFNDQVETIQIEEDLN